MARGCLSLVFPFTSQTRLPVSLPALDPRQLHHADRIPALRAQRAAEAAVTALARPDMPEIAVMDLASQLANLLGVVHRIVADLATARRFLERNDPDKIAREKTEIELRRLGASASEILALRAATDALASRAELAERVRREIGTLEARLVSAGQELEAFRERVSARTSAESLGHELTAYQRSAELALEAFERTRAEMGP